MHDSARPRSRRIVVAGALTVATVLLSAAPAAAHTVGGEHATDYRTRVLSVRPAVAGISVRAVDSGDRLELTNSTGRDVVVVGYDEEPYLRVGPRGVFENRRSPATYLNRTREEPEPSPASADPAAKPRWRRVGTGDTVRWHDHRAHWMGLEDPPSVQRARGEPHLVQRFEVELRTDGQSIVVRGDVRWIPGPSVWPWVALALASAVAVVVGARTRWSARVVGAASAIVMIVTVVHALGAWGATTSSTAARAGDTLPTLGAVALDAVALVQLVRRGMRAAAPLLVFAGLFVGIAIGLADVSGLAHSQLPTTLPDAVDRLTIALALGGGFGVAVGAAFHIAGVTRSRPAEPASEANARAAFEARAAVGRGSPH